MRGGLDWLDSDECVGGCRCGISEFVGLCGMEIVSSLGRLNGDGNVH